MICYTEVPSPLGKITLASNGAALAGLWLEGQKYFGGSILGGAERQDGLPIFRQTQGWLGQYFSGEKPAASQLPLAPIGSLFREKVWNALLRIPYGQTATYGAIARELGASSASQAVGSAVSHNPISIIIPCHRVVGASGSLTGYAGGIEKKVWLLKLEGADTAGLFVPKKGTAL
ncbi:methylated-DNA--[protein]-cysteine S-methyltransferase [Acutalibacter sp. 1XD8-33]|uniref:methylated-DNA--[protein]-cysteine S-methyltransferase n=1 Tax=Acutalibacter sp. 1XD8-33 TaxID=2320081 RepID=UPI000EA09907|nr:methylated-DNA--[protein]-cysteine S-methyltransferase [Acutalibacter sp. 1XD8-33]RKJ41514.1 methylated-DNA--[protein]-cysteine S-methyltransferase [Acutalibacter sp. 1XD8-33]